MRSLAMVLVLLGAAGVVFGALTMMEGAQGPGGQPFRFENYGGPGPLFAGIMLVLGGLYLRSVGVRRG